MRKAQKTVV